MSDINQARQTILDSLNKVGKTLPPSKPKLPDKKPIVVKDEKLVRALKSKTLYKRVNFNKVKKVKVSTTPIYDFDPLVDKEKFIEEFDKHSSEAAKMLTTLMAKILAYSSTSRILNETLSNLEEFKDLSIEHAILDRVLRFYAYDTLAKHFGINAEQVIAFFSENGNDKLSQLLDMLQISNMPKSR